MKNILTLLAVSIYIEILVVRLFSPRAVNSSDI